MEPTKESCNIAHALDSHVNTGRGSLKQGELVAGFVISPLKQPATASGPTCELYVLQYNHKHTTKSSRSPHNTAFDGMEMLCQCQENWDASEGAVYSSPFCKHHSIPAKPFSFQVAAAVSALIPTVLSPYIHLSRINHKGKKKEK